ncbi:hypothetical protein DEO72_LG7g979 [Vigna unguiculata]|uniref:Uncharacterized protein n=1 Tax=Vigna unguiculata TaxID=3917 RepID=A0A4D6MEB0_VIGUN|nr:hypothetical protein DEO72_LG7g979 [Vigna unguiculata]
MLDNLDGSGRPNYTTRLVRPDDPPELDRLGSPDKLGGPMIYRPDGPYCTIVPSGSSIWPSPTRLGHWPNVPDGSDDPNGPDNPDGAEYPDRFDDPDGPEDLDGSDD